ncbi:protein FAM110D [Pelodytes ibericus]
MIPISPPVSPLLHKSMRGASASDRLEADKAKYVKTPQVIERRQNPVINANFTPVMARRTVPSATGAKTEHTYTNSFSPAIERKSIAQYHKTETQADCSDCTFITSRIYARPLQLHDKSEAQTGHKHSASCANQKLLVCRPGNEPAPASPETHPQCLRRVSTRRLGRPDSLVIYRQRRDVSLAGKENNEDGLGLVIRLLQGTPLLKRNNPLSRNPTPPCPQEVKSSPRSKSCLDQSSVCQSSSLLVPPSHETGLDEQAATVPIDVEHFFETCGLESSLLNLLENLYKMSGDTPLGSMESITNASGCREGTFSGEEKEEKTPVSVIERNARVIKWIYSCQRARANGDLEKQMPRESTV